MFYLCDFICMVCPIFVWLVKSMSCLSGLCAMCPFCLVWVLCLVCLGYLSFLTTSHIASVLCTCISIVSCYIHVGGGGRIEEHTCT